MTSLVHSQFYQWFLCIFRPLPLIHFFILISTIVLQFYLFHLIPFYHCFYWHSLLFVTQLLNISLPLLWAHSWAIIVISNNMRLQRIHYRVILHLSKYFLLFSFLFLFFFFSFSPLLIFSLSLSLSLSLFLAQLYHTYASRFENGNFYHSVIKFVQNWFLFRLDFKTFVYFVSQPPLPSCSWPHLSSLSPLLPTTPPITFVPEPTASWILIFQMGYFFRIFFSFFSFIFILEFWAVFSDPHSTAFFLFFLKTVFSIWNKFYQWEQLQWENSWPNYLFVFICKSLFKEFYTGNIFFFF